MKLMLNGKEVSGMGHYVMAGDIKDATAEDSNVLSGKAYYNNNGKREGTMPNRGGMSVELAAGGSVSIPEGYHDGTGSVRAQDLASQTQATAAAANIEAGYTAWVNGEMVEGGLVPVEVVSTTYTPTTSSLTATSGWDLPEEVKGKDNVLMFTKRSSSSGSMSIFLKRGETVIINGYLGTMYAYNHDTGQLRSAGMGLGMTIDKYYIHAW